MACSGVCPGLQSARQMRQPTLLTESPWASAVARIQNKLHALNNLHKLDRPAKHARLGTLKHTLATNTHATAVSLPEMQDSAERTSQAEAVSLA